MECPKAALFDLDNTLAEPFQRVSGPMAASFGRLIGLLPSAIMSAASFERIEHEVLSQLPGGTDLSRLTLFAANAAQAFSFAGGRWEPRYRFSFTEAELSVIRAAIEEALRETNVLTSTKVYGEQFIDYKGYFAFTGLGAGAPIEERRAWDPDLSKRKALREAVQEKLPQFDVYIGGSTSIDVTKKGINKSYGIRWLSEELGIEAREMLYVGDALYENGNDFVVIQTGVQTRPTKNPEETLSIVGELLEASATR